MAKKFLFILSMLLAATVGASADDYRGTLERHGVKMEYAFSGGKVTNKKDPVYGGAPVLEMATFIDGEVEAGTKIKASCKKLKGLQKYKEVKIELIISKSNGQYKEDVKKGNGSAEMSAKVPDDATFVEMKMSYRCWRTQVSSTVRWKVVKKVNTGSSGGSQGTFDVVDPPKAPDGTCHYTISGGRNFRPYADGALMADFYVGEQVTVTVSGKPKKNDDYLTYTSYSPYRDYQQKKNGTVTATFTIKKPMNDLPSSIEVGCKMNPSHGSSGEPSYQTVSGTNIHINIVDRGNATTPVADNFKWDDIAKDENCPTCKQPYSHYEYHSNGNPDGAFAVCHESNTRLNIGVGIVIYFNDVIVTGNNSNPVILSRDDDENFLSIGSNSQLHLQQHRNGDIIWDLKKGTIVAKYLHPTDKKPIFQLSNCTAAPRGTVFALEDNGKTSRVWLLAGEMDVTSKKTSKRVTLKPGQASTVDASGNHKLQTFDIKAAAKKFGIPESDVENVTPATTPTKRYKLQRAIVKYKVTKGTQVGHMAKAFDNYGQLERRELQLGNQQTLVIARGNITYTLDTKKKTAKPVKNAELNFLDLSAPLMQRLNLKKKGTEKVMGKKCTVYESGNTEFYVWEGIVLKKVVNDGNITTVTEATAIEEPTSIDAATFKIPNGYTTK